MAVSFNATSAALTIAKPAVSEPDLRHGPAGQARSNGGGQDASATSASAPTTSPVAYKVSTSSPVGIASSPQDVAGVQPDVDGDGARLLALQVQQALSAQPTSIANSASQSILSLLKS